MATIQLDNLGKRFGQHWLFRNLNITVNSGDKLAVTGNNGSGKSTLLHLISGHMRASEGKVMIFQNEKEIPVDEWYSLLSWTGPYIEIIEEFTPMEFLDFYREHKPFVKTLSTKEIISLCKLEEFSQQVINSFSSGMKQRLKLATAILTDVTLLLLDEPLSNLDEEGCMFYQELINTYTSGKTVIICSNDYEREIFCCNRKLKIGDYK